MIEYASLFHQAAPCLNAIWNFETASINPCLANASVWWQGASIRAVAVFYKSEIEECLCKINYFKKARGCQQSCRPKCHALIAGGGAGCDAA
jgi:hypothetical protein